jgi:hypothetical protein
LRSNLEGYKKAIKLFAKKKELELAAQEAGNAERKSDLAPAILLIR